MNTRGFSSTFDQHYGIGSAALGIFSARDRFNDNNLTNRDAPGSVDWDVAPMGNYTDFSDVVVPVIQNSVSFLFEFEAGAFP